MPLAGVSMVAFSETEHDIDPSPALMHVNTLKESVIDLSKQGVPPVASIDPVKAFGFDDPMLPRQWHLFNRHTPGNDVNVTPVWQRGITGKDVVVCIIDDGVDYNHKDISRAFRPDLSWDFNENVNVPVPRLELNDRHGTRCAGLIAGEANNGICGVGVAFDAQISAIRILSRNLSTKAEASAVTHKYHQNHIYSCSWGPADDGIAMDGPPKAVLKAFIDGLVNGRDGKGSIYVFASGNGKSIDNCNYDGYANGIFSATIGAIDCNNAMPVYMEPCSAQLAVTYSSGYDKKIVTTDLGNDSCTVKHGGTSAAAPLAAGIFALVLQARPELTWRDLQYLVIESAQPVATLDTSWKMNGVGRPYSQKFGFGRIDADRIVSMAQNWKLVRPPHLTSLPFRSLDLIIPTNSLLGIIDTIVLDPNQKAGKKLSCIERIEQITVTVDIEHPCRGELQVFIRSPSGMVAQLASRRPLDTSDKGLRGWTFMTVAFWGESPYGAWTLNVVDKRSSGKPGKLIQWRMTIWGESFPQCHFDKDLYENQFLNAYYPPSPGYFNDVDQLWFDDLAPSTATPKTPSSAFGYLILAVTLALLWKLVKRFIKRFYSPIPSNTVNTM